MAREGAAGRVLVDRPFRARRLPHRHPLHREHGLRRTFSPTETGDDTYAAHSVTNVGDRRIETNQSKIIPGKVQYTVVAKKNKKSRKCNRRGHLKQNVGLTTTTTLGTMKEQGMEFCCEGFSWSEPHGTKAGTDSSFVPHQILPALAICFLHFRQGRSVLQTHL